VRVLLILFGAAFTAAGCWAAGALLLRRLRLPFDPLERLLFSFLCGAPCLSTLVFLLCLAHFAYPLVFLCAGASLLVWAVLDSTHPAPAKPLPSIPKPWKYLLILALSCYLIVYFFNVLAPEVSPDGAGYHLGNAARNLRHHGFVWEYRSMYSAFPQGMEMLFLVAFAFGQHSSAALVHFIFFAALPVLILCYGRRFGLTRAAAFAAVLLVASPLFGVVGTSAYNDVALVTCIFAVFYCLEVWHELKLYKILILVGILAGYCFALKYTGGLAIPFALLWCSRAGDKRQRLRQWLAVLAPAAVVALPWLLRNWFWLANPFSPFFNRWFPNPYSSVSSEKDYLASLAHFESLRHWWEFPLEVTVYGSKIPGFLGPVFLLAPFAFLSLRHSRGRRLLAAAAVFSVPMAFNADTRFLMPAMPFVALALGSAVANSPGVLPALAFFQTVTCWLAVMPLYTASWSWRIREIPVRAAFRMEPESAFIGRHFSDYRLQPTVESLVPQSQIIFSFRTRAEAYFARTILVGYESAAGLEIQQILLNAVDHPDLRRSAAAALKRRNVGFLMVSPTDPGAEDFRNHLNSWGIALIKEVDETSLYQIE
jgi:hypothetical protein